MASVLEGVIQELLDTAGVTALTSTRISPGYAPQETALPYIVVAQTGGEPQYHSTAEAGIQQSQFAVNCYGATILSAVNVAEQVRLALSGKPAGDLGGVNARRTTVDDIRDTYSSPGGEGDEVGYPSREVLVTVWHNTAIPSF